MMLNSLEDVKYIQKVLSASFGASTIISPVRIFVRFIFLNDKEMSFRKIHCQSKQSNKNEFNTLLCSELIFMKQRPTLIHKIRISSDESETLL